MIGLRGPQAGQRRAATAAPPLHVPQCTWTQSSSRMPPDPTPESSNSSVLPGSGSGASPLPKRRPRSLGPEFCIPEKPRNYLDKTNATREPRNRPSGRLMAFGPKEKVNTEPKEAVSDKCLFECKPRLASKLYTSPIQVSISVAKIFLEKKEVSSKKINTKVSFKNIENRVASKSIENKDISTNLQPDLWSSSFVKEITGGGSKAAVIAKQEKNNEYCLQNTDDKLSDSTDDDGEDNTNDEDDEDCRPKETRAPLELMAEFLRAEMGRDYQLAKKLCQMILLYEPENPEAKEFLSLIEEMLLREKDQNVEEDSEEDSSCESEDDSSEGSSDECEAKS